MVPPEITSVPVVAIACSPTNPRTDFDPAAQREFVASIRTHGVLVPVLVRPRGAGKRALGAQFYELIAGERRWRAAQEAGLTEIPARVLDVDDEHAAEIALIENLQRADLSALEEADGYRRLVAKKVEPARIAERVGRSVAYVYDRLRLAQLTEDCRELLRTGEITTAHALILSRLTPDQQALALTEREALFTHEELLIAWDDAEEDKGPARKPRSVRELQAWVDKHFRVQLDEPELPQLFPELAEVTAQAEVEERKVVLITREHYVQPTARDGQRILGPASWKRAEEPCDDAAIGVVAVGAGRGQSFPVCTAKKTCRTHWAAEIKAAQASAREAELRKAGGGEEKKAPEDPYAARQAKDDAERKLWVRARPEILKAIAARVRALDATASGVLADLIREAVTYNADVRLAEAEKCGVKRGKTAEDFLRQLAFVVATDELLDEYAAPQDFPPMAKRLGIDLKPILAAAKKAAPASAPVERPETKPAKRKGGAR